MNINFSTSEDGLCFDAETNDPLELYDVYLGAFLEAALPFLSEGYRNEICPAIVCELWLDSGRLIMYDSPVGNRLRERDERRYTQLISASLLAELDKKRSEPEALIEFVWNALKRQFCSEKTVDILEKKFIKNPDIYAVPYDEFDSAFNVVTGDFIQVPDFGA